MKTKLPDHPVTTIPEAKLILLQLVENGEIMHPEDDAHDVIWTGCDEPTHEEKDRLNKLFSEISQIPGFDACDYVISLNPIED